MSDIGTAEPQSVDYWTGEGIRLSEVVDALADLRDQSTDHHSSARTAVMTLVAVAPGDEQAYEATGALRSLAGHHPSRIVLLRPDPDSVAHLGARATLYALDSDHHHRINFEEVMLEIGGQAARHLDSFVEAFTLSDLPVAVWYVNSIPEPSDPLLSVATAILIDSRDAPDPGQLRSVLQLARRRTLVDLSWTRLRPWRELLSALFDPPASRPWLDHLDTVEITGKEGPRRLLGGWLSAQTGVSHRRISLQDARHVSIRLAGRRDGQTATFTVERVDGQRMIVAEANLPDGPTLRSTNLLPDDPLATSLANALTHLRPDPIWERALSAATALVD
ncbi:MAG TPA: glucose-6-phosphate dehydrogenase assembly protein OpcA [Acidimicrobiales bacterium]|jgi:glucose-6-phosphate dehydrogenase assembly protein OpcA|nr:glucose-6-phosphate dehydrogenase assembly protein OpcA [Acidimicrobiales bacterium]